MSRLPHIIFFCRRLLLSFSPSLSPPPLLMCRPFTVHVVCEGTPHPQESDCARGENRSEDQVRVRSVVLPKQPITAVVLDKQPITVLSSLTNNPEHMGGRAMLAGRAGRLSLVPCAAKSPLRSTATVCWGLRPHRQPAPRHSISVHELFAGVPQRNTVGAPASNRMNPISCFLIASPVG